MTDAIDKSKEAIAKVLVENNVLSQAQVDLAYMDMDIQDLPFEEVLYMRGWLTQEKLYELAPFLKPDYKSPPKQTEKKEPAQKKSKAKASQDEAPMLIALGAPQEEPAKETPVIALASPSSEEQTEETPLIALAPPAREELAEATPVIALAAPAGEKEEEKQVIALGAPPEDKADEAPPKAFSSAKEENSADSLFSMESPKQSSIAENSDSLFGGSNSDSADWLFASEKPATKAKDDVLTASSIKEEAVAEKSTEDATVSAKVPPAESKETADSEPKASEPKGIASVSSARTEESAEDKASDTAGGGAAKSKPTDIPGEPPIRSAERPAVIQSPVEKSKEQSLKAYKEILRKILTVEKK